MTLTTLAFGGLAFGAGVIVGVVLGEKGIVTSKSLEQGGQYVVDTTMAAARKVRESVSQQAPGTPPAAAQQT